MKKSQLRNTIREIIYKEHFSKVLKEEKGESCYSYCWNTHCAGSFPLTLMCMAACITRCISGKPFKFDPSDTPRDTFREITTK